MAGDRTINAGGSRTQGGSITLTGAVQNLPEMPTAKLISAWIQNKTTNANRVFIVDSTQGVDIAEVGIGQLFAIDIGFWNVIGFRGTAGQSIYWGVLFE